MKKTIRIVAAVLSIVTITSLISACGGGNGKEKCQICGSKDVYAYGYCEKHFNKFIDYTYD